MPHFFIIIFATLYVFIGAKIFQLVDWGIANKPYRIALLYAFQTCSTVGWGDTHAKTKNGQLLTVFYTLFGIPIMFSAFANIGRLMSEFYCVDWFFLTAVVRRRVSKKKFISFNQFIYLILCQK